MEKTLSEDEWQNRKASNFDLYINDHNQCSENEQNENANCSSMFIVIR